MDRATGSGGGHLLSRMDRLGADGCIFNGRILVSRIEREKNAKTACHRRIVGKIYARPNGARSYKCEYTKCDYRRFTERRSIQENYSVDYDLVDRDRMSGCQVHVIDDSIT